MMFAPSMPRYSLLRCVEDSSTVSDQRSSGVYAPDNSITGKWQVVSPPW
jgi:hypothetical protein